MSWIVRLVLDWLAAKLINLAQKTIKYHVEKTKYESDIDSKVKSLRDVLKEVDQYKESSGHKKELPIELERKLRNASRDLVSNFISD